MINNKQISLMKNLNTGKNSYQNFNILFRFRGKIFCVAYVYHKIFHITFTSLHIGGTHARNSCVCVFRTRDHKNLKVNKYN